VLFFYHFRDPSVFFQFSWKCPSFTLSLHCLLSEMKD
jgi:hypothetical protein